MYKVIFVVIFICICGCAKTNEPVSPTLKWTKIASLPVTSLITSSNSVYVGCTDQTNGGEKPGLYTSDHLGDTWIGHIIPNSSNRVLSLAFSGPKLYVGTESKYINVTVGTLHGVHETSNDGLSWISRRTTLYPSSNIECIVTNGNDIFLGTDDKGVYYSNNSGNNWFPMNLGMPTSKIYSLSIIGNKIWAGTDKGIILSSDYGNTWSQQVNEEYHVYAIASSGNIVCAVGSNDTDSEVLYSSDGGLSWKNQKLPSNTGGVYSVVINNRTIYIGAENGMYISADNCTTWQNHKTGLDNGTRIQHISISNNYIYAGSYIYGLYRANLNDLK